MSVICYRNDFAGRDEEYVPVHITPGVRYLCFTDKPTLPKPWQAIRPHRYFSCPRVTSLWHKTHPHEILPKHSISVFMDASVGTKQDITPLLNSGFCVHRHRHRNCLFKEAAFCKAAGLVDPAAVEEQCQRYADVSPGSGLWESGVLIRGSHAENNEINELWWDEITRGTLRDQISLAYLHAKFQHITDLPGDFSDTEYFYTSEIAPGFEGHGGPLPVSSGELKVRFPRYFQRRQEWGENVRRLSLTQGVAAPAVKAIGGRERKTIITGTGRCGTTCLIQLLTRAGLDTGLQLHDSGHWASDVPGQVTEVNQEDGRILKVDRNKPAPANIYMQEVNAGCETLICLEDDPDFVSQQIPEVIKDPRLAWYGHELVDAGILDIRHLIVCVRDLNSVATSKQKGMPKHDTGKWYQHTFEKIYDVSAWQLGVCVAEMTTREIPMTFLRFPLFVKDEAYFLRKMMEVFPDCVPSDLLSAWKATVREELIHSP